MEHASPKRIPGSAEASRPARTPLRQQGPAPPKKKAHAENRGAFEDDTRSDDAPRNSELQGDSDSTDVAKPFRVVTRKANGKDVEFGRYELRAEADGVVNLLRWAGAAARVVHKRGDS